MEHFSVECGTVKVLMEMASTKSSFVGRCKQTWAQDTPHLSYGTKNLYAFFCIFIIFSCKISLIVWSSAMWAWVIIQLERLSCVFLYQIFSVRPHTADSSLQPPADIILLDHDSRWQYTDWAHRRSYDPSSIHHALSKKYIYVGRYIHESMTKPTIYISQFLQEL